MTIGYLKDLQHLRAINSRKDYDDENFTYEVNYFDTMANLDPSIKEFISD